MHLEALEFLDFIVLGEQKKNSDIFSFWMTFELVPLEAFQIVA